MLFYLYLEETERFVRVRFAPTRSYAPDLPKVNAAFGNGEYMRIVRQTLLFT